MRHLTARRRSTAFPATRSAWMWRTTAARVRAWTGSGSGLTAQRVMTVTLSRRTREHCALSVMLTVSQLSKSFAGRALFDDVSLQVNRGDRIGLVGPNGAGKSTLFSLILGETSPDNGTIAIEKNATIGFLPQETAAAVDETVLELALAVSPELVHAQKVIKQHESTVAGIADPGADAKYHR